MNLVGLVTEKRAELTARADDRLRNDVETALRGANVISTNSLLHLVGIPRTTGSARRIAKIMRTLNFVQVKSRALKQAGFRDSGTRGWARATQIQALATDRYILLKQSANDLENLGIVHDDANFLVGSAYRLPDGRFVVNVDCQEVDIVNSIDSIIPAVTAYYEAANTPRWESEPRPNFWHTDVKANGPRHMKDSPYGPLIVFQIADQWVAYRNQCELLFNGQIATFATREEAQCKADAHERDGYPNSKTVDDGYSWIYSEYADWRRDPHMVAYRTRLMVQATTH